MPFAEGDRRHLLMSLGSKMTLYYQAFVAVYISIVYRVSSYVRESSRHRNPGCSFANFFTCSVAARYQHGTKTNRCVRYFSSLTCQICGSIFVSWFFIFIFFLYAGKTVLHMCACQMLFGKRRNRDLKTKMRKANEDTARYIRPIRSNKLRLLFFLFTRMC